MCRARLIFYTPPWSALWKNKRRIRVVISFLYQNKLGLSSRHELQSTSPLGNHRAKTVEMQKSKRIIVIHRIHMRTGSHLSMSAIYFSLLWKGTALLKRVNHVIFAILSILSLLLDTAFISRRINVTPVSNNDLLNCFLRSSGSLHVISSGIL